MVNLLVCFVLSLFSASAMATEGLTPVEGMQKDLFIYAFPAKDAEGQLEGYVYSRRELDNVWVDVGAQDRHATSVVAPKMDYKVFTYKIPGTIDSKTTELKLHSYDVASKALIFANFTAEPKDDGIKFGLVSYEYTDKNPRHVGFRAFLVETSPGSGVFHVDFITLLPLGSVYGKTDKTWTGTQILHNDSKLEKIYRLSQTVKNTEGLTVEVRAKKLDRTGFVQKFVLKKENDSDKFDFVLDGTKSLTTADVAKQEREDAELHALENRKKLFGGAQYSPQEVAQARAEYMAARGWMGCHIGFDGKPVSMLMGMVPTSQGGMWEGTGFNRPTCSNGNTLIAEGRSGGYIVHFYRPWN